MLFKNLYPAAIPDKHIKTRLENASIQTSVVLKLETMTT
jgi:hypothetical protein